MNIDMTRIRRETLRWRLLQILNHAQDIGIYSESILCVTQTLYSDTNDKEIRRELDYLSGHGLIAIEKQPHGRWHTKLTSVGIDFVEYTINDIKGISRPSKQG